MLNHFSDKAEPVLVDGFERTNGAVKYIIEDGYRKLQARGQLFYEFIYAFNKIPLFSGITCSLVSFFVKPFLKEIIIEHKPDKINIFHFFLIKPVMEIIKENKLPAKVFTIVTDPYTPHPIWFLQKKQNFIVFSKMLREKIEKMNISHNSIEHFPFILDSKFASALPSEKVNEIKKEKGFDPDKKLVLLMGGGDGLPSGEKIIKQLMPVVKDNYIVIVCGKNESLFQNASAFKEQNKLENLIIFRFIDFVYELINISDIIITKCGASTFMEILLQKKVPVVINYLWEQEKGNMEFLRDNNLGIYEKRLNKLPGIVSKLLTDKEYYRSFITNIEAKQLKIGTSQVADYLIKS